MSDISENNILSRRQLLKIGTGLSAIALMPRLDLLAASAPADQATLFSTGQPAIDEALRGGLRPGTLTVVIGPRGSGKTRFLQTLAQANGILDATAIGQGASDMLSIMRRDGKPVGHLMADAAEPWTDQERSAIGQDSAAHHAFLHRWFARSREVLRDSGGIFVFSIQGTCEGAPTPDWTQIPDYVIALNGSHWKAVKL